MNGDPYLDPHSGVLLNKFGLSDHDALAREEQVRTGLRGILLKSNPVPGNFDLEHLQSIHQYLFQDIYDWAGQVRTISMAKADLGSVTHFTPPELIKRELDRVFNTLAKENFLRALTRAEFARKAARLLSDINQIHPFRDGNGRTQREFLRQIAESGRHSLHFEVVSRARMVQASIRSAQNDLGMMERLFDEITDSARIRPLKDAVEFFEKNRFARRFASSNFGIAVILHATPRQVGRQPLSSEGAGSDNTRTCFLSDALSCHQTSSDPSVRI